MARDRRLERKQFNRFTGHQPFLRESQFLVDRWRWQGRREDRFSSARAIMGSSYRPLDPAAAVHEG